MFLYWSLKLLLIGAQNELFSISAKRWSWECCWKLIWRPYYIKIWKTHSSRNYCCMTIAACLLLNAFKHLPRSKQIIIFFYRQHMCESGPKFSYNCFLLFDFCFIPSNFVEIFVLLIVFDGMILLVHFHVAGIYQTIFIRITKRRFDNKQSHEIFQRSMFLKKIIYYFVK